MESLSSKNPDVKFLWCVIDVFTKYVWVKCWKIKKTKKVLHGIIKIGDKSYSKSTKSLINEGRDIYKYSYTQMIRWYWYFTVLDS